MAAVLIKQTSDYIGTAAERAGLTNTPPAGSLFFEHDTLATYKFDGTTWRLI